MAKTELSIDFNTDYELVGIISSIKDFQLAFYLNKYFKIELCRERDHKLDFRKGNSLEFPVFCHEDENSFITVFGNKPFEKSRGQHSFLIKERKEFDFLLKIEGYLNDLEIDQTVEKLKEINTIQFVQLIELENIDSKENLIY